MSPRNSGKKLVSSEVAKIAEATALMLAASQEATVKIKASATSNDEYTVEVEYGAE